MASVPASRAEYVCQLDKATEKKAKDELGEHPKDRLKAVQALRTWIEQQPHITCRTTTLALLAFLRTAKFSQLKARELIENYARLMTVQAHWLRNIDMQEKGLLDIIDAGYSMALPKKDRNGCAVLLIRLGVTLKNGKLYSVADEVRAIMMTAFHLRRDENVTVNGYVVIVDMAHYGAKHLSRWSLDDVKKFNCTWQNAMPGRFKAIHYINTTTLFEAFMAMVRPVLSKKFQERVRVHDTLESLYKQVSMELLPEEYLPDEYRGPNAGSLPSIMEKFKREVTTPEFRQLLLEETSPSSYNLDESKRPNYKTVNESFRKLAVD